MLIKFLCGQHFAEPNLLEKEIPSRMTEGSTSPHAISEINGFRHDFFTVRILGSLVSAECKFSKVLLTQGICQAIYKNILEAGSIDIVSQKYI